MTAVSRCARALLPAVPEVALQQVSSSVGPRSSRAARASSTSPTSTRARPRRSAPLGRRGHSTRCHPLDATRWRASSATAEEMLMLHMALPRLQKRRHRRSLSCRSCGPTPNSTACASAPCQADTQLACGSIPGTSLPLPAAVLPAAAAVVLMLPVAAEASGAAATEGGEPTQRDGGLARGGLAREAREGRRGRAARRAEGGFRLSASPQADRQPGLQTCTADRESRRRWPVALCEKRGNGITVGDGDRIGQRRRDGGGAAAGKG